MTQELVSFVTISVQSLPIPSSMDPLIYQTTWKSTILRSMNGLPEEIWTRDIAVVKISQLFGVLVPDYCVVENGPGVLPPC